MNGIVLMRECGENFGGIERQVCRIAENLVNRGVLLPVLVTSKSDCRLVEHFKKLGCPWYAINMRGGVQIWKAASLIGSLLRVHHVRALQAHSERESMICRLVKASHPDVINIYRLHVLFWDSELPSWRKWLYYSMEKATRPYVDKYFCISRYVQSQLRLNKQLPRAQIIRNAYQLTKLNDNTRHNLASCVIRDACKLPLPLHRLINYSGRIPRKLAMVGSLVRGKGHLTMLKAVSELQHRGYRTEARVVGAESTAANKGVIGAYGLLLRRTAAELGVLDCLELYGETQDVPGAIADFPLFLMPSEPTVGEGTPGVVIEALQMGKIVVASRVAAMAELVNNEVTGYLHEPGDWLELSNILQRIFDSNPAVLLKMSKAASESVDSFSEDAVMTELIQQYQSIGVC